MDEFDLTYAFQALSSDEGQPFGEADVSTALWTTTAADLVSRLIRLN